MTAEPEGWVPAGYALVPIEPTEEIIAAYGSALKAYIEATPPADRNWRLRKTSGGVWSGYRIAPAEKAICRYAAMIAAAPTRATSELGGLDSCPSVAEECGVVASQLTEQQPQHSDGEDR